MRPWSPLVKNIWWIFWQTLQYQWPFSVRSGSCPAASPNLSVFGGNLWYSAPLCILRDEMAPMETPASLWNVRTWSSAFSISGSVIFSNVSSSRSPCAILAVDAIVSTSKGWSIQDTLSVFSSSPKSSRDALAAPLGLGWDDLECPFWRYDSLPKQFILGWRDFLRTSIVLSTGNGWCLSCLLWLDSLMEIQRRIQTSVWWSVCMRRPWPRWTVRTFKTVSLS